jgi:hypothetical protein
MDSWETHFREKSHRRSRRRSRRTLMKAGVLALVFGSLAAGIAMIVLGVPK